MRDVPAAVSTAAASRRGRLSAQSVLGSLRLRRKSLAKEAGPPSTALCVIERRR